ncbi:MAG: hypothetical protein AAGE01_18605 [Pseudomonadota bacterium]
MKAVLAVLTLLSAAAVAAESRVLDDATVLDAVIRNIDDFDYAAQAMAMVQREPGSAALDEDTRAARVAVVAGELQGRVEALDDDTVWTFGDWVRLNGYDEGTGRGRVVPSLIEIHSIGFVAARDPAQLKEGYFLVINNQDAQRAFEVPAEDRERVGAALADQRRLFARIDMNLGDLLQDRHLVANITRIRYFRNPDDEAPVATFVEPRTRAEVIAASLLREGLSLDVVPNHHLDLDGGRLLDPLESGVPGRSCLEAGRFEAHLVVRCTLPISLQGIRGRVAQIFVGGRLVQSAFTAEAAPRERLMRRFEGFLTAELDRRGSATSWTSRSGWTARYDGTRWGDPERLGDAPYLVITATAPGFRFDEQRIVTDGADDR